MSNSSTRIVFQKEISLRNPYILQRKNFLIFLYSFSETFRALRKIRLGRIKLGSYVLSFIKSLANLYGMYRLSKNIHRKLKCILTNNEAKLSFSIRDTNSQFCSIYSPQYKYCYEPDVSGAIEIFLPQNGTFVDIGSNWGHHAFSSAIHKNAEVVIFEPNPLVFSDVENICKDLNIAKNRFELHNIGLSNFTGEITLEQKYFESGLASIDPKFISLRDHLALNILYKAAGIKALSYTTKVTTLDACNLKGASVIKIDAEGVELEILLGARETIKKFRPVIIFEYHSNDLTLFQKFSDFFVALSYNIYQADCTKQGRELDTNTKFLFTLSRPSIQPSVQYNLVGVPEELKL